MKKETKQHISKEDFKKEVWRLSHKRSLIGEEYLETAIEVLGRDNAMCYRNALRFTLKDIKTVLMHHYIVDS